MCGVYFDRCYIDNLNDTLLELILLKLFSWKHLSTFKCVSKRWYEVISNPDFVRQFTYQYFPLTLLVKANNETCVITEHPYFIKHKFCLNFLPSYASDNIVAYHNDLLIIQRDQYASKVCYYIANPLRKQFVIVPLPLIESDHRTTWGPPMVGLAGVIDGVSIQCVNNIRYSNIGFRIVRIFCIKDNNKLKAILQIYSSRTGQWRTQPLKDDYRDCWRRKGVTFDNKVYWLGVGRILIIDPFSDDIIAPRVINVPEGTCGRSILGLCRARLRIATLGTGYGSGDYPKIKVWEFEDCGEDLTKFRLVINFSLERYFTDSVLSFDTSFTMNRDQMICCHPNDPDIVYFFYGEKVFCCNLIKPRLKAMSGKLESYCVWGNSIVMTHPLTM